jgi:hypothetical protein
LAEDPLEQNEALPLVPAFGGDVTFTVAEAQLVIPQRP